MILRKSFEAAALSWVEVVNWCDEGDVSAVFDLEVQLIVNRTKPWAGCHEV